MNRDERQLAIEQLERISAKLGAIGETIDYTEVAIKALQIEPKDAISKALVCEILGDLFPMNSFEKVVLVEDLSEAYERIVSLPYIQPKAKPGKWILVHPLQENDEGGYMCSECGTGYYDNSHWNYCPNCGNPKGVTK